MSLLTSIRDRIGTALAEQRIRSLESRLQSSNAAGREQAVLLTERLHELELALQEEGWQRLASGEDREFSAEGRRLLAKQARNYYLKNPLIGRGIDLQALYVFGQGVTVQADDDDVNAVVQDFWDDAGNQVSLTSAEALLAAEQYLGTFGNLYVAHFTDPADGKVRVRLIPTDEICEILTNPQDRAEPWFYRRTWQERSVDPRGAVQQRQRIAYYPALFYEPAAKPPAIDGQEIMWDAPVLHRKVNCLCDMQFGLSEAYRAMAWARAHREYLEDWVSMEKALSRFAWRLTGQGGQRFVDAAKGKTETTFPSGSGITGPDTNPAPLVGSMFIAGTDNIKLDAIPKAGASPKAEDARELKLLVAAAFGFPETFFGDADVGNHATAKTLDRPTELKIMARQGLWSSTLQTILRYVIERAATSPNGALRGRLIQDMPGQGIELKPNQQGGEPVTTTVRVVFPPILDHDTEAEVNRIVKAVTLDGKQPAQWASGPEGVIEIARRLLLALGDEHVDETLEKLFPGGVVPEPPAMPVQPGSVAEAARDLREAIERLAKGEQA